MEGQIQRWRDIWRQWENNYFVLHEDILTYCPISGGKKLGSIHMKIASITESENTLEIYLNTGTNVLRLRFESVVHKIKWISSLKEAKLKIVRKEEKDKLFDFPEFTGKNEDLKSIWKMFQESSKLSDISEFIGKIWSIKAKLDSKLSSMLPHFKKMKVFEDQAKIIEKLANKIKINSTQCARLLDEEIKNLNNFFKGIERLFLGPKKEQNTVNFDELVQILTKKKKQVESGSLKNIPENDMKAQYKSFPEGNHEAHTIVKNDSIRRTELLDYFKIMNQNNKHVDYFEMN